MHHNRSDGMNGYSTSGFTDDRSTAIPSELYNIRIVETIALAAEQHAHYQMPF